MAFLADWTTERSSGNTLRSVVWHAFVSRWITVGDGASDVGEILSAEKLDLTEWVAQTSAHTSVINDLATAYGQLSAVGVGGDAQRSVDGITWTADTPAGSQDNKGVAAGLFSGSDAFISVGTSRVRKRLESSSVWSATDTEAVTMNAVFGNAAGEYSAVGSAGLFKTSENGQAWAASANKNGGLETLGVWFDEVSALWCAVGAAGSIRTSTDRTTWTSRTSGVSTHLYDVRYVVDQWIAVGTSGTILTSFDGINWTQRTSGTSEDLFGVGYDANGTALIVGDNGYVLSSQTQKAQAKGLDENYKRLLQNLLPRGPMWNREEDSNTTELIGALAIEPSRVELRGRDLLKEFDPTTVDELIDDWERITGLPGSCTTPTTLAERRTLLAEHLKGFGDPNQAYYISFLERHGFLNVTLVNRHEPFAAGQSAAGDALSNDEWQYTFRLDTDSLDATTEALVACRLPKISPLHTLGLFDFKYYQVWTAQTNAGSFAGDFYGAAVNTTKIVIVGTSGEIQNATIADPTTWAARSAAAAYAGTFRGATIYGTADNFCIVGDTASIQRSTDDGDSWVADSAGGGYGGNFRAVAAFRRELIIVGASGEIQTSTDGGTWTHRAAAGAPYAGQFNGVAMVDELSVVVGASGEIQYSTDNGFTWVQATADNSFAGTFNGVVFVSGQGATGYFYAFGSSGEVQRSEDGINWEHVRRFTTNTIYTAVVDDSNERILFLLSGATHHWYYIKSSEFDTRVQSLTALNTTSAVYASSLIVIPGDQGKIFTSPKNGA